jgi:hypothetical protein
VELTAKDAPSGFTFDKNLDATRREVKSKKAEVEGEQLIES